MATSYDFDISSLFQESDSSSSSSSSSKKSSSSRVLGNDEMLKLLDTGSGIQSYVAALRSQLKNVYKDGLILDMISGAKTLRFDPDISSPATVARIKTFYTSSEKNEQYAKFSLRREEEQKKLSNKLKDAGVKNNFSWEVVYVAYDIEFKEMFKTIFLNKSMVPIDVKYIYSKALPAILGNKAAAKLYTNAIKAATSVIEGKTKLPSERPTAKEIVEGKVRKDAAFGLWAATPNPLNLMIPKEARENVRETVILIKGCWGPSQVPDATIDTITDMSDAYTEYHKQFAMQFRERGSSTTRRGAEFDWRDDETSVSDIFA